MADDDDDVPLLNEDAEQLITSDDRPPNIEAVFVVTFDVKDGITNTIDLLTFLHLYLFLSFKVTRLNFNYQVNSIYRWMESNTKFYPAVRIRFMKILCQFLYLLKRYSPLNSLFEFFSSYFRHGDYYGLASLARLDPNYEDDGAALSLIDQSQRGLKIKSVGILTSTIHSIQSYLPLLQHEAKFVSFSFIHLIIFL